MPLSGFFHSGIPAEGNGTLAWVKLSEERRAIRFGSGDRRARVSLRHVRARASSR